MDAWLSGKRAVIAAGSQGLGLACATKLAESGCDVAICGRGAEALAQAEALLAASGRKVVPVAADLSVGADVTRFVDQAAESLGGIDILVVNSGHIPYGSIEDLDDAQWQDAFELLLMSAVRLVRRAIPVMRSQGGGDIVFIGSATVREPHPQLLLSGVMRLGVMGLAKTLSRGLAAEGIRMNVVSPGYFDSGRIHRRVGELVEAGTTPDDAVRQVAGDNPSGRLGTPAELAELVAFVVGGKARFMTGSVLTMDGGAGRFVL